MMEGRHCGSREHTMCHRRMDIRIHNARRCTRCYRSAVLEILRNDGGSQSFAGESANKLQERSAHWRG